MGLTTSVLRSRKKGVLLALDVMFGVVVLIAILVAAFTIMSNHSESVYTNRLYLQQTSSDILNAIFFEEDVPEWSYTGSPTSSHALLNQSYLESRLDALLPSTMDVMLSINIYRPDGKSLAAAAEANTFVLSGASAERDVVSGSFQFATFGNDSRMDYVADVKYYAKVRTG